MISSLFKWMISWRVMLRCLFVLACLATLTGLFYTEEDWRGKRAWAKVRRELEAKGEVLDWNEFIPPSVPDDQNIFKAPKMTEWFASASYADAVASGQSKSGNVNAPFSVSPGQGAPGSLVVVAEVDVNLLASLRRPGEADAVLRLGDAAAGEQAAKLLRERIGPCVEGPTGCRLIARPLDQIKPVHLVVQSWTVPTAEALSTFLSPGAVHLEADRNGSNTFRVSLKPPVYTAADYLARSESAVPDLDLLRKAIERPYARIDGSYERPFERPIAGFVRMRNVAQLLSQRAQCYLLLGKSEAAWHELALIRGMCRMLEAKPGGNCPTLVEAMIDVAISGLYTSVIQEGLRLGAWRETELAEIQKQLLDMNLLEFVRAGFYAERAYTCRTLELTSAAEQRKLFRSASQSWDLWGRLKDPVYLLVTFAPRGWLYQNLCVGAQANVVLGAIDVTNNQVLAGKMESAAGQFSVASSRSRSPYAIMSVRSIPNFLKATRTMARNQTMADEAFIACGLERYRLAHGEYPESLDVIVPQFAAKLPHDIIGGEPLKYHRTADGRCEGRGR